MYNLTSLKFCPKAPDDEQLFFWRINILDDKTKNPVLIEIEKWVDGVSLLLPQIESLGFAEVVDRSFIIPGDIPIYIELVKYLVRYEESASTDENEKRKELVRFFSNVKFNKDDFFEEIRKTIVDNRQLDFSLARALRCMIQADCFNDWRWENLANYLRQLLDADKQPIDREIQEGINTLYSMINRIEKTQNEVKDRFEKAQNVLKTLSIEGHLLSHLQIVKTRVKGDYSSKTVATCLIPVFIYNPTGDHTPLRGQSGNGLADYRELINEPDQVIVQSQENDFKNFYIHVAELFPKYHKIEDLIERIEGYKKFCRKVLEIILKNEKSHKILKPEVFFEKYLELSKVISKEKQIEYLKKIGKKEYLQIFEEIEYLEKIENIKYLPKLEKFEYLKIVKKIDNFLDQVIESSFDREKKVLYRLILSVYSNEPLSKMPLFKSKIQELLEDISNNEWLEFFKDDPAKSEEIRLLLEYQNAGKLTNDITNRIMIALQNYAEYIFLYIENLQEEIIELIKDILEILTESDKYNLAAEIYKIITSDENREGNVFIVIDVFGDFLVYVDKEVETIFVDDKIVRNVFPVIMEDEEKTETSLYWIRDILRNFLQRNTINRKIEMSLKGFYNKNKKSLQPEGIEDEIKQLLLELTSEKVK